MVDRQTIQSLIDRAYALRKNGDVEGIVALFHPQAVFELAGSKAVTPVVGAVRGHQDLRTTLAGLISAFEFIERDVICTVIDGERAAIQSRVKLRYIPKNRTVTTDMLDLWRFENGKVTEFVEFADTATINDLMK
jgi:ketosteroid isomerase-like protein